MIIPFSFAAFIKFITPSLILGMIVKLKIKPLEQDEMDSCSNGFFY